jgi:pilus assembly protein CpaC
MRTARGVGIAVVPAVFLLALFFARAASAPPAEADPPARLSLTAGKSAVVDSDSPIERISVGFGDVVEATAIGPRELLLNGKTPGVTSLIVWQEGGIRRFYDITVVASHFLSDNRVEAVEDQIKTELPGQTVNLTLENETVFLRGTVKDMTSADRAVSIASTLGKTVNLLYVDVPPQEPQILLRVKFASVDRNISTQLGMNILSTGTGKTVGSVTTQQFSPPGFSPLQSGTSATATLADALNFFLFRTDLNLGATIEALELKGLLQVLSEPNVLAENGKQASFLAGGEFPFPSVSAVSGGVPVVSIQFREFGIRLLFTPTITARGSIHLRVAPEVSALDFTNGLSISGFNVPALTTRKLDTQVELSEGQSFAIGGLLDNRTTDTLEKIPFIGDIPILGKFFQSKNTTKQNTELIVIVTPELVRPIPVGQPLPGLTFPKRFMAPSTSDDPRTPGVSETGPVPDAAPLAAIPVEKLVQSLQPPAAVQPNPPPANAPAVPVK